MSRAQWLGFFLIAVLGLETVVAQDFPGAPDLEKAFEKKLNTTSLRDLDEVVSLCQSAIEKGLNDEGKVQAKELMVSAWLEYAEQLEPQILGPVQDRRWRVYRREALARLQKAVEEKPDNLSAHLLIARLHTLEGGDRAAALSAAQKAIELAANDQDKLAQALMVRAGLADSDESRLNDLNQAVKIAPDSLDAIRARGALYLKMEQPDKALEDFRKWTELEPENLNAYLLLVEVLTNLDRQPEALEVLDQAIAKNSSAAGLLSLRARIHLDQTRGKSEQDSETFIGKALDDANAALKIDENDMEALIVRATIHSDKKQFEEAMRDINKVLEIQPGSIQGIWIRSLIQASDKKYDEAIKDVQVLVNDNPANDTFQLQLAALYNAKEDPRPAIQIYDRILRVDPENARALRGRGDARLSLGEHKLAIEDYDTALEFEPEDDGVLNNLAWVLATSPTDELRDGKRALELATKACDVTHYEQPHILSTLASAHAELGDFDAAIKWVKEGIEKSNDPTQKENLTKELNSYMEKKPWRELQNVEEEKKQKGSEQAAPDKAEPPKSEDGASGKELGDDGTDKDEADDKAPEKAPDKAPSEEKKDGFAALAVTGRLAVP